MKKKEFILDHYQIDDFFKPIRSKRDVIILLMKSIKLMLIGDITPIKEPSGHMYLIVSKMSRLFYVKEDKYFTIGFPFKVIDNGNTLEFYSSFDEVKIDNKITSDVLALFSNKTFVSEIFFEELYYQSYLLKILITNLFTYEDDYIRYDYDPVRTNGKLHPLNHYDLFYCSNTTFKLGLNKSLNIEKMIDCLSIETECHFIE